MGQAAGGVSVLVCCSPAAFALEAPAGAVGLPSPPLGRYLQAELVLEELSVGGAGLAELKAAQYKWLQLKRAQCTAAALQLHPVEAHQIGAPGGMGWQPFVVVNQITAAVEDQPALMDLHG